MPSLDYVFFGSAPWDAPWLTEHNLAHAVAAKGRRVLFIEPPISLATPLRGGSENALGRLGRRGVRIKKGVAVFQPLVLPPVSHSFAQRLSTPIRRRQIRDAIRHLELDQTIFVSTRDVIGIGDPVPTALHVYLAKDWIQAGASLLGRDEQALSHEVSQMCTWADLVFSISPKLNEGLVEQGVESVLLRHGFHGQLAHLYDDAREPPDLGQLSRPILGYAGRIDLRLDIDLLVKLARYFGQGTILLLGPVSPRLPIEQRQRLIDEPNIVLAGTRSREELPAYLRAFDCSLMPYCTSEWLKYGSPLKLWDLLYAGPPIVGSGCDALREYAPDLLSFAGDHDVFIREVDRTLEVGEDSRCRERRAFALANTWERRAVEFEDAILKRMGATTAPVPGSRAVEEGTIHA